MIKLDKRLTSILEEIEGDLIADIGCDHGKLAAASLIKGKCNKVIAGDVSLGSLSKTIKLAEELGLVEKIDCRLSDGFDAISENIDTAIIAGLGGYEIRDILSRPLPNIRRIVLCPHQNVMVARRSINLIGYGAIKDYVVKEGHKYYQIIVAERGCPAYSKEELRFGKNFPYTNDYFEMLKERKATIETRFDGKSIPSGEMQDEYQEIMRCLK